MSLLRRYWVRLLLLTTLDGLIILGLAFHDLTYNRLPRIPDDLEVLDAQTGVRIFAAGGELLYTLNRSVARVTLDSVSPWFVQAVIATEDAAFYDHRGVSLKAVAGAFLDNVLNWRRARGGSTITQQIVKNLFLSREKRYTRKLKEALLAVQMETMFEHRYGESYKDKLLELYINGSFYGTNAYGIADAAQSYFAKSPGDLSLPEAAFLAGLPNAPSAFSPTTDDPESIDRARRRTHHVLRRMAAEAFISKAELDSALAEDVIRPATRRIQNRTPYFVETIKLEIARLWGRSLLSFGALDVHTTLDLEVQRAAEAAISDGLTDVDRRLGFGPYHEAAVGERPGYVQAALVCIDPRTGHVRAMVGGRDIFTSYYNRVTTARRQPGSGFKPIVYLSAFESGTVTPVSLFIDKPRTYTVNRKPWSPSNFADSYLGLTTAAWGLINSANATAVQVVFEVGPDRVVRMGERLGIVSPLGPYPSIALGASEVTLLELASAYGTIANFGVRVTPTFIKAITDRSAGKTLYQHIPSPSAVFDPALAGVIIRLLENVVDRGTGRVVRRAGITGPVAGKTGTTNDNTDAWFTGFTPDLVASVWIGFDDRRSGRLVERGTGRQITGGGGAAPIWADFIRRLPEARSTAFYRPDGTRLVTIDPTTGVEIDGTAPQDSLRPSPITIALPAGVSVNTGEIVSRFLADHPIAVRDTIE